MFCLIPAEHENAKACFVSTKTSYTSTGEGRDQPCALWSGPPDSLTCIPLGTICFLFISGNHYMQTCRIVLSISIQAGSVENLHQAPHVIWKIAHYCSKIALISCRGGGGGNLFIPKSIFLQSLNIPLINFFSPCL